MTAPPIPSPADQVTVLSLGPDHPLTRGGYRVVLDLEGERIVRAVPEIGFSHGGAERIAEEIPFTAWTALSEKLSDLAVTGSVGYCLAVEALLGIAAPARAAWLRTAFCEIARIADHLGGVARLALAIGADAAAMWCREHQEKLFDLFALFQGPRNRGPVFVPGGMTDAIPPDLPERTNQALESLPRTIREIRKMAMNDPLWNGRTRGVGVLDARKALGLGVTGPALRAGGVALDLRRDVPYLYYDRVDFDVITARSGDVKARLLVALFEILESKGIIEQCMERVPEEGPLRCDTVPQTLPENGQIYSATEAPGGQIGFFITSRGDDRPQRLHVRAPSFFNAQALPELLAGEALSDAGTILAGWNLCPCDMDR